MRLYYGVVENNVDYEKLGKVQVRIVGKHTDNRTDPTQTDYMPVADLPWAQTLQTGSAISHESALFSVPKNGTVVILSYIDDEEQLPIILGCVPKIPETLPDFSKGFSDPMGENPSLTSLGTSPVSNYATGEPVPDAVTVKRADIEVGVQCNEKVWNEPITKFDPDYPDNYVIQNGKQVLELDDSTGKERINLQHSSGTFKEIHPDGSQVVKIKGQEYLIVEGDRNILIKGGCNITVRGIPDVLEGAEGGAYNLDATILNLKALTSLSVDTDGILSINAGSANISIDGLLTVTATMISLN